MKSLCIALISLLIISLSLVTLGQGKPQTTGNVKGKVKVQEGSASGVTVTLKRADRAVASVETNRRGEFAFASVTPGVYSLSFRKAGLAVGTLDNVNVTSGRTVTLDDGLIMKVDEGSVAFVRGSVFDQGGHSVPGVKVEIARLNPDGSSKKIDTRISTEETGQFAFRLPPTPARYRVTAKRDDTEPVSQILEIDGAAVYRVSLILPAAKK